jgi:predicted AAA+ superfamily ATPase
MFKVIRNHTVTDIIFFLLPKVKNATSYFKNGLKNRFRAIAIRADEHFPFQLFKSQPFLIRRLPRITFKNKLKCTCNRKVF